MGAYAEAVELYHSAQDRGGWHRLIATLRRRSARLLSLVDFTDDTTISSRHYLGSQIVEIGRIRGSEGHSHLFDDAFFPLDGETRIRWISVATAWLEGIGLPPIELIRIGDVYFVRDGHHRISVARAMGLKEIEANVTEWKVASSSQAQCGGMNWEPLRNMRRGLRECAS